MPCGIVAFHRNPTMAERTALLDVAERFNCRDAKKRMAPCALAEASYGSCYLDIGIPI